MSRPVTAIRNLGPVAAVSLAKVGVTSAEEIEAMGADATYLKFLEAGDTPHFMAYAGLVNGLNGRAWNDFETGARAGLLRRFEELKAQHNAKQK